MILHVYPFMKRILLIFALVSVGLGTWIAASTPQTPISKFKKTPQVAQVMEGDLIFQTDLSRQSRAVQLATHSKYSHVGIIFVEGGEAVVYEAMQPVQVTPLDEFIKRGKDDHFVIKRLVDRSALTPDVIEKMRSEAKSYVGKKYDLYFEWSDDLIYCSELVWKVYEEAAGIKIGELKTLKSFDLDHDIVQKIMKERYGDDVPYDELVISPGDMFNSDLLKVVQ
jgi:hypothetical protein